MEKNRKEKNQNIQVFVRLRPLNQREHDIRSLGVVEVYSSREVLVRNIQNNISKKFTFDRAFGPNSKQVDVHQTVVSPLIEEVLAGYNCTVFAYGQTGTGKTHTMVGESSDHKGSRQNDPMAGIIPRSLGQLFDELRLSNSEFTVRVSYLELYNEELFDLLAPLGSGDTKLKMYESSKGSSEVKGLEELLVRSKDEVYQILAQGQERRRIASTLMNAQSSRSHTVFTIVVRMNMKEPTADGEELVKTGKLNLVDLAGSENISKAGSDNPGKGDRKRECVVINQSLLTLGRVITALVERHPHIPYRESKLTRLLQESLGGRTKTSIIATISPGHKDLEETLSTLEYAHRARNIQNKPEINQRVLKTQMMCEMVEDLDRLKRDLYATREQKGIYYSEESHAEVQLQLANQKKEIQEQILQIKAMKEEAERLEGGLRERVEALHAAEARLETMECSYRRMQDELREAESNLSKVSEQCEEQRHLVSAHGETEARLGREAREVRDAADLASAHAGCLHSTIAKRRKLEQDNLAATQSYGAAAGGQRARIRQHLDTATERLSGDLRAVSNALETHAVECLNRQQESKKQMDCLMEQMGAAIVEVSSSLTSAQSELSTKTREHRDTLQSELRAHGADAAVRLQGAARTLAACLERATQAQREAVDSIRSTAEQWSESARSRLLELQRAHAGWYERWSELERAAEERACADATRRRDASRAMLQALIDQQKEATEAKERLQREIDSIMTKKQTFYASAIESARIEVELATSEACEAMGEREAVRECVGGYREQLAAGMAAAGEEVGQLCRGMIDMVGAAHERVATDVDGTRETVEGEMAAAAEAERQASDVLSQKVAVVLADSQRCGEQALASTLSNIQKYHETSSASVVSLCDDVGRQWSGDATLSRQHAGDVLAAESAVTALRDEQRAELQALDALEEAFLHDEYKSYSPTGKTPVRIEYRYPRNFTVTSPHDRIISRFRAQRTQSAEDECIELLDDSRESGARVSDADTSALSTGSAAVFLQPSPPLETPTNKLPPIHKSTSESDIFSKKKNQKENQPQILSNASSLQKLSKLRQPNSHKKVLTQKN